ncbi:nitrate reductase [Dyella silvae]|uniref:nitrate reductase n=1 Tax=Dyella silvae TaxID=2994424 RepID=UPI0031F305D5
MEPSTSIGTRKLERTTFLLLLVLFPVLSVMFIAAFGFAVWFWQMFVSGPPHV